MSLLTFTLQLQKVFIKMFIQLFQHLMFLELQLHPLQMGLTNFIKYMQVQNEVIMFIMHNVLIGGNIQIEMMLGMKEN